MPNSSNQHRRRARQLPLFPALPAVSIAIPPPDHRPDLAPVAMPLHQAHRLTGRAYRTLARWRAAGEIPDRACLALLQAHAHGLLPHPRLADWRVLPDGRLQGPPGAFHADALAMLPSLLQDARQRAARHKKTPGAGGDQGPEEPRPDQGRGNGAR